MQTKPVLNDPAMVAKIVELDSGWASDADIAWNAAEDKDSYADRSRVKICLGDLYRAGLLKRMYIRHRDQPLCCYLLEPSVLNDALDEWQR